MATFNKKAQGHGNVTVLVILLFMAAAIVFYAISVTPEQREELLGYDIEEYSKDILDVKPGELKGITEDDLETNTQSLSMITVDYAPEKTSRLLASQLEIKQSITSDTTGEYDFEVSKASLDTADLTFKVIDKKGDSNLLITLNEQTIFDSPVEMGTDEEINLPVDLLLDGTNKIEIFVSSGSKFWQTKSYKISDLTLNIGQYTSENAIKTQTFTLPSEELSNFVSAKYQAFVKQSTESQAVLKLELNEYEIYNNIPEEETRLVIDLPRNYLKSSNVLRWSVAKDGVYDIEFGKIVTTTAPSSNFEIYTFTLGSINYRRMSLGQYDCLLTLARDGGDEAKVDLNANILYFDLSEDTETKNVCEYLIDGTNTLIVSAEEDDVILNQLTLTLKSK